MASTRRRAPARKSALASPQPQQLELAGIPYTPACRRQGEQRRTCPGRKARDIVECTRLFQHQQGQRSGRINGDDAWKEGRKDAATRVKKTGRNRSGYRGY